MCKKFRYLIVLKRFIIIWILLVGVLEMRAQYDPSFSHYFDMEPSFNPAAVGKQSKLNVTAAYALISMIGLFSIRRTAFFIFIMFLFQLIFAWMFLQSLHYI